jgi:hypothetical protein
MLDSQVRAFRRDERTISGKLAGPLGCAVSLAHEGTLQTRFSLTDALVRPFRRCDSARSAA